MNNDNRPARRGAGARAWTMAAGMVLALLAGPPAQAGARPYTIAAPAEWVEPVAPAVAQAAPREQVSDGVYFLLADVQTRVEGSGRSSYRHFAAKALNEKGVESVAHVEIAFDPSYQTLVLHGVDVHRQGRVLPRLPGAEVRILQREKELEAQVYDGSKSAHVFVEDVRVGDVVEYAYTLRGVNPALAERQAGRFDLQWQVPVHRVAARLLWPEGRPLRIANRGSDVQPTVRAQPGFRDYRWRLEDRPPLMVEADSPAWFDPYPSVQWSEFRGWAEVADWARPMYRRPAALEPALQREVDRIAALTRDPGERVMAALRFVQREIRYLGVEVGAGSYVPNPPRLVLQRRFGDCKDKTLLTLTLLDALGVRAAPALVNTRLRRGIAELQPSPGVFNHVLVRARLSGRDYWLDPTRLPQPGMLDKIHQPDFGHALVLEEGASTLTPMRAGQARGDRREVHALLEVAAQPDASTRYTITTVLEGAGAEDMRARLALENRDDLQKRYVNHYARYYPGLTQASPLDVRDEGPDNRLTTVEHYVIPQFWRRSDERRRHEGAVPVPDLHEWLRAPAQLVRHGPLATPFPFQLTHVTELRMPEDWPIKPEVASVSHAAFDLDRRSAVDGRTIRLTDHLRWHTDHVEPAAMSSYAAKLDEARKLISYELYWRRDAAPAGGLAGFNWSVGMVALLLTGLYGWLAVRLYRHDPPAAATPAAAPFAKAPSIGGWLLVPALGLVLGPLRRVQEMLPTLSTYGLDTWSALTTVGTDAYHPLWAPLLLFELAVNLAVIIFSVVIAVLFFQKRRSLPKAYVGLQALAIVFLVLDHMAVLAIPQAAGRVTDKETAQMAWAVLWGALWCAYFLRSDRVRRTFVNGRRRPFSAPGQATLAEAPAAQGPHAAGGMPTTT